MALRINKVEVVEFDLENCPCGQPVDITGREPTRGGDSGGCSIKCDDCGLQMYEVDRNLAWSNNTLTGLGRKLESRWNRVMRNRIAKQEGA